MSQTRTAEQEATWQAVAARGPRTRPQPAARTCGESPDRRDLGANHLVRRADGGRDEASGCVTLCDGCHAARHPRLQVALSRRMMERWALRLAAWLDRTGELPDETRALAALRLVGDCCFARRLYGDDSAYPSHGETGVLRGAALRVERFDTFAPDQVADRCRFAASPATTSPTRCAAARHARGCAAVDSDLPVRIAAIEHLHRLAERYTGVIPRVELLRNLEHGAQRYPIVNPQSGIHRPRLFRGPAALTIVTAAPKPNQPPPYEDAFDLQAGTILYSYRQGPIDSSDNRALRAAFADQVPLIYLMGVAPAAYALAALVYVVEDRPADRAVLAQIGSLATDLTPAGLRSDLDERRYALVLTRRRLHQQQFRVRVLAAYRGRCTICALREPSLVQAAHIVDDADQTGVATVQNGLALCAIHHLAYDRHVLGIDPRGVVHIADRLLEQRDGPMLREGLQSFHTKHITPPARVRDRPDPQRLEQRWERFRAA